jgi:hypothetical protein
MALLDPRLSSTMAPAAPAAPAAPWWRSPRVLGFGLVALVHAGLIAFVLSSLPMAIPRLPVPGREVFFLFPPPKPARLPQRIEPPHRVAVEPYFRVPLPTALAPHPRPQTASGLGLALFGCAPETLANLTPDERAHCGGNAALEAAAANEAMPGALREPARDADRWQAAIALRENGAMPCVHLDDLPAPNGLSNRAAVADPLCFLKRIEQGGAP